MTSTPPLLLTSESTSSESNASVQTPICSSPPPYILDEHATPVQPSLATLLGKKRRFSFADELSSDPLFSDEASEAELQDHGSKRKRAVRGPWWNLQAREIGESHTHRIARPKLSRHHGVDSGVWMGSDDSLPPCDAPPAPSQDGISSSDPLRLANSIILQCLDDGNETVDLSNLGLDDMPGVTTEPLRQLIPRMLNDRSRPPSVEEYQPLTPSLKVFLAGNHLKTFPAGLLKLRITVLSLRNNMLTELPYTIDRFQNLRELNLSGNQLKWLPWGLLDLASSTRPESIVLTPNPFLSIESLPEKEQKAIAARYAAYLLASRTSLPEKCFLGSVNWTYLAPDGRKLERRTAPARVAGSAPSHPSDTGRVPSLYELALLRLQGTGLPAKTVIDLLPHNAPSSVCAAVEKALGCANEICSTCGRDMIMGRVEWIEFWLCNRLQHDLSDARVIPFLRRACSNVCAEAGSGGDTSRLPQRDIG